MTLKELFQLGRDAILLLFVLYLFTGDVALAASGITLTLNHAVTVVVDGDHSAASRALIERFRPPYFQVHEEVAGAKEGVRLLDRGDAMVVLDVPPQFERDLLRRLPAAVQMQVDATNSVDGLLAAGYGAEIVGQYGLETGLRRAGLTPQSLLTAPVINEEHRVWFNPDENESWTDAINELLLIVTFLAILLPAAALVREKERGTVEQLLVAPLTPFQIMFPKVLAMTVMILAGTALSVFGILEPLFHVPARGSLPLFFAVTALYAFTTAGLGLLAATVARNLAQTGLLTIFIAVPMMFLSGTLTPPEALPAWMQMLMRLSLLTYYITISFGVFLKGAGVDVLWPSIAAMAALGAAIFGAGLWRFRRQFG
jgi:ABC-2 type transport system permease protein